MRTINLKTENPMNRPVYNAYRIEIDGNRKELVIETFQSQNGKAVLVGEARIPVSNKQDAITYLEHSLWQGKQVRNTVKTLDEFGVAGPGQSSTGKRQKLATVEVTEGEGVQAAETVDA